MSESNYNWVCFDCRSVVPQPKTAVTGPKCPKCGEECYCLGDKFEVPKTTDARNWRKLRLDFRQQSLAGLERETFHRVRELHAAERRIAHLQGLVPNKQRVRLIAELKDKVRALRGESSPGPLASFGIGFGHTQYHPYSHRL